MRAAPKTTSSTATKDPDLNERERSAKGERTFGNIVAGSTAVAFALVFCSLACVAPNATGALDFQWQWTALVWLVIGALGGWYFWRLAWWSESAQRPHAKAYFIAYVILLCLLTLFLFVRPLQFVSSENLRDVIIGMGLAILVLSFFGWMIFTLVRWFNSEE